MQRLYGHCAVVIMQRLSVHYAAALWSLCGDCSHYAAALSSLCSCSQVIMHAVTLVIMQRLSGHYTAALWPLCNGSLSIMQRLSGNYAATVVIMQRQW